VGVESRSRHLSGESVNGSGKVVGHIDVDDGDEKFEVAGGPPTKKTIPDNGGHTAARTPPGHYVLGKAEHHTTKGWPNSVVPWGATIREINEIVQFNLGEEWVDASGPSGRVTLAFIRFFSDRVAQLPLRSRRDMLDRSSMVPGRRGDGDRKTL
jgi:hypothetical protein